MVASNPINMEHNSEMKEYQDLLPVMVDKLDGDTFVAEWIPTAGGSKQGARQPAAELRSPEGMSSDGAGRRAAWLHKAIQAELHKPSY
ncbi:calcium-binding protein KIC-like [Salvia divinorum]|uniref:Calcium-binding protein KIC-like n=1 Tax=Salvia divinorum TaxID=28513 RepID=A0ABD1H0I3_SALDI